LVGEHDKIAYTKQLRFAMTVLGTCLMLCYCLL